MYGWATSKRFPVKGLTQMKKSQFNVDFTKGYNEKGVVRYSIEVDVKYAEYVNDLHNDFQFLPERIKIKKIKKL